MNTNASGVYCILNLVNGKVYIGSTAKSLAGRWKEHKSMLSSNKHRNRHLQAAWDIYKPTSFQFIIIYTCPPENCIALEQTCIDEFKSADRDYGYNLSPTAGSNFGFRYTQSDEARAKMSQARKGVAKSDDHKENIASALRGKTKSPSHRAALAKAQTGKKATAKTREKMRASSPRVSRPQSVETRRKISESLTRRNKSSNDLE